MPESPLLCRMLGHHRSRRLWHSRDGYRSLCKRCGVELGRSRSEAGWHVVALSERTGS